MTNCISQLKQKIPKTLLKNFFCKSLLECDTHLTNIICKNDSKKTMIWFEALVLLQNWCKTNKSGRDHVNHCPVRNWFCMSDINKYDRDWANLVLILLCIQQYAVLVPTVFGLSLTSYVCLLNTPSVPSHWWMGSSQPVKNPTSAIPKGSPSETFGPSLEWSLEEQES